MTIELFMLVFLGLIFAGVPMAFAMAGSSAIYFLVKDPSSLALIPDKIFEGLDNIILTAIPFFLLAGELMNRTGMAERLIHFSDLIIGRVRGGFAYVNVLASLLFSGITGVAVGDIAALGKIEVTAMGKAWLPACLCCGCHCLIIVGRSDHPAKRRHHSVLRDHEFVRRRYVSGSFNSRSPDGRR